MMRPEEHSRRAEERWSVERWQDERSLGDLLAELTRETRTLVRQEIDLAKAELKEEANRAKLSAIYIGAGGALAYVGLIVVVFAVVFLLAYIMPLWLSALLVGVVVAGIGYVLIRNGTGILKHSDFTLERTRETLKEDKQWLKSEMK